MSESSLNLKVDVTLTMNITRHIPNMASVPSSVMQQIGRFDIFRFWEQRVMVQIMNRYPDHHYVNLDESVLEISFSAPPDAIPNFIEIGATMTQIVLDTALIPPPEEVDAFAYLRHRWSSNRTLAFIPPGDGNFELHRDILIGRYGAVELLPGTVDRWRLTNLGKKL